MSECLVNTISEATDLYLMHRGIEKKKYFSRYLTIGKYVWQDIFQKTLWVVNSTWLPMKAGEPYNYVELPSKAQTLFSVGVVDECNLIQPLFYNSQLNVLPIPTEKKCGCRDCDCAGTCQDVNSLQVTTKLLFSILGTDYYEKTWIEYCKNGDVIEWSEIPTKKYNSIVGDGGDFNDDYNNDYSIGYPPFSDYEIVTVKTQKKICKLDVLPCGCPINNEENSRLLLTCCGLFMDTRCQRKHCDQFSENINNNHLGEVKLSDCGTKIFYKPSRKWKFATDIKYPKYLLVNYQTDGQTLGQEIQIPTYALMCYWAGLDYRSKKFNDKYGYNEKKVSEYAYNDEKANVISYLNPISLIELSKVQDERQLW